MLRVKLTEKTLWDNSWHRCLIFFSCALERNWCDWELQYFSHVRFVVRFEQLGSISRGKQDRVMFAALYTYTEYTCTTRGLTDHDQRRQRILAFRIVKIFIHSLYGTRSLSLYVRILSWALRCTTTLTLKRSIMKPNNIYSDLTRECYYVCWAFITAHRKS